MRIAIRFCMAMTLCAATVACGARPQAQHARRELPDVERSASADSADEANAADDADNAKSSAVTTVSRGEDPKDQGIAEICKKLTHRAGSKCSQKIAGLYQESCQHYLKKPGECTKEIRDALKCQLKASDEILCAHQADPSCAQVNRNQKVCERGSAPEEQTTTEAVALPSGWEVISDSQLGFKVALPAGASLDSESKRRTWKAEEGGVTYYVAAIEPPAGKLNNQTFVRTVIAYVGSRCQLRLKLRGELETKGTTVVQYESGCPDGSEWHGMLHFWNGKAVSTGFHGPAGANGVLEPFFYSFLIAK